MKILIIVSLYYADTMSLFTYLVQEQTSLQETNAQVASTATSGSKKRKSSTTHCKKCKKPMQEAEPLTDIAKSRFPIDKTYKL